MIMVMICFKRILLSVFLLPLYWNETVNYFSKTLKKISALEINELIPPHMW